MHSENKSKNSVNFFLIDKVIIVQAEARPWCSIYPSPVLSVEFFREMAGLFKNHSKSRYKDVADLMS